MFGNGQANRLTNDGDIEGNQNKAAASADGAWPAGRQSDRARGPRDGLHLEPDGRPRCRHRRHHRVVRSSHTRAAGYLRSRTEQGNRRQLGTRDVDQLRLHLSTARPRLLAAGQRASCPDRLPPINGRSVLGIGQRSFPRYGHPPEPPRALRQAEHRVYG
jgi:hypothetical protein